MTDHRGFLLTNAGTWRCAHVLLSLVIAAAGCSRTVGIPVAKLERESRYCGEYRDYRKLPTPKALAVAGDPCGVFVSGLVYEDPADTDTGEPSDSPEARAMQLCEARRIDRKVEGPCTVHARGKDPTSDSAFGSCFEFPEGSKEWPEAAGLPHVKCPLQVASAASATAGDQPVSSQSVTLGEAPLCEASSGLPAPWNRDEILIADNEVEDHLFKFRIENGLLTGQARVDMPDKDGPHDIEALTAVGIDRVLAVGSHSRNKECEVTKKTPKRKRLRLLALENGALVAKTTVTADWDAIVANEDSCVRTLFVDALPETAREPARRVCAAIVAAEGAASADNCQVLNIEGAATVPDPNGRVWLGLRSPLVDGDAVLLRLIEKLDAFRFDDVSFVDVGKRGVRALQADGDRLWGIGGPTRDQGTEGFQLWNVATADIGAGAKVKANVILSLPASSEGLVLDGKRGIAIIDGKQKETEEGKPPECEVSAGQRSVALP